jgi:hypothetical protein
MKDGASEAEQKQLQPSPKRQGLATYVRVLRSSRFLRTISVFVFWNRLVLCLSSRKFRTLRRSPVSRLRGCIWIWNKGALRSQEDPIRPAHSAPALRDTAQARPPFPERANHAEQPICPDRLIELCGGSGSGRGSERERERLQIDYHGSAIPSQLPPPQPYVPAGCCLPTRTARARARIAQHSTAPAPLRFLR